MSERKSLGQSLGRVKTIVKGSNYGFVRDMRLKEELFALFEFELQANPGEWIAYEVIEQREKGRRKLRAEDIRFGTQPELEQVFAWAQEGLGPAGLEWLKLQILRQPELLSRALSPPTHPRVIQALLADPDFPLPATTLAKAMASPRWRRHLAGRLRPEGPWTPETFTHLLEADLPPRRKEELVLAALQADPALPFSVEAPKDLPPRVVLGWQRKSGQSSLLLLLPELRLPLGESLALLRELEENSPLHKALREHSKGRSWRRLLGTAWRKGSPEDRPAFLAQDPAWQELLVEEVLAGRGDAMPLLKELQPDRATRLRLLPALPESERDWALAGVGPAEAPADLPEELRLRLYEEQKDPAWLEGLKAEVLPADMHRRPGGIACLLKAGLDETELEQRLLADLEQGLVLDSPALGWLSERPGLQERAEAWLSLEDARRELALECLCQRTSFEKSLVQRLLLLPMEPDRRQRLAAAIQRVSPERFQERYLLSQEEKAQWQEAGAPFS